MNKPLDDAVYRLETLQRQILTAEATLAALQAAIVEARSERGVLAAGMADRENERLRAENRVAVREVESAHAALEVAVRASQTDVLTGLHNREVLWDRLAHDITVARRHGTRLVVYFMDVDGFKRVNDEFGHAAGDLLLQRVAQVLVSAVRASDTVCRLGGDEFVVLAAANAPEDAQQVASKIRQALAEPSQVAGQPMSVTASIGYSVFPDDGESPGLLVQKADEAMYRAKREAARSRF